jgi:uncharacterized protein YyaL (SSP411 family)
VSTGYDLRRGWLPAFPETTGYIAPTFFNCHRFFGRNEFRERAFRMLDWLCTVQQPDGSIAGVSPDALHPIVFDTGQVLFGFVRGIEESSGVRYSENAKRSAEWLVSIQDPDGGWSRFEYLGEPHAYNTRVAWALLEAGIQFHHERWIEAAARNIGWALARQNEHGWFAQNAFSAGQPTFTHTIAYAIQGIMESGLLRSETGWVDRAILAADALLKCQHEDGFLAASYGPDWSPTSRSSCLTGIAQMAVVWYRLVQSVGGSAYQTAADRAVRYLLKHQERSVWFHHLHGALAGSYPINGQYLAFVYPNWAAKFLCDALMLSEAIAQRGPILDRFT